MRETTPEFPQHQTGEASARPIYETVQYRRRVPCSDGRAREALLRAIESLRYDLHADDPAGGEVRFTALGRVIAARVLGGEDGTSSILIEFVSLRWMASGGSTPVILPGVVLGALLKAHDAYFARGFLGNVQRILDGKEVGRDSARLPGMEALRRVLEVGDG